MTHRMFSDKEILDPEFPDVRMKSADHREARHRYYRKQVTEEKRKTALVLYKDGWIAILWRLWHGF